ncbi:hypothetical protein [Nonomuraea sp. GTA35]|uniref:hypothetical protein n=1 Tax=Nonomuraea sp. GTA35 TaxID=1676746 RepID=UPI0035C13668
MIEIVTAHADGAVSLRWEAESDRERDTLGHIPRLLVKRERPDALDHDLRHAHAQILATGELPPDTMRQLLERSMHFLVAQP